MSIADQFSMGNEAIARGALESGIQFAAGYPGTPSSEIIQKLSEAAETLNLHVEWSTNEKGRRMRRWPRRVQRLPPFRDCVAWPP
jgi:TPP-dependent indolepyruvate ferredoxin oxidoreductase alpha subunit